MNGHDLFGALLTVHRGHFDPVIRELAGEAHDKALRWPLIGEGFLATFREWDREDRPNG